jgi:hypothetical protein
VTVDGTQADEYGDYTRLSQLHSVRMTGEQMQSRARVFSINTATVSMHAIEFIPRVAT